MSSKKKDLILVVSDRMDTNRKEDRNENALVRMAATTRDGMGFTDNSVELWDNSSTDRRLQSSVVLTIFKAFSQDISKVREMIAKGELEADAINRVGFVTSKTYKRVLGDKKSRISISDRAEDTVIGADPEFLLFHKEGGVVRANNIPGFDKVSKLGSDGAMAELRPDPSITAEGLVANIRGLLEEHPNAAKIAEYSWRGGVYYKDDARDYPIGGHIHIGNPAMIARMDAKNRTKLFKSLNKILDELLALPMTRLDGELGMHRRTMCQMGKYGYFGEFRECNGRLEHRTLSGMWFSHPKLASIVLGVTKAIIDEVFRHVFDNKFNIQYILPDQFSNTNLWMNGFDKWDQIPLVADMGCVKTSDFMNKILNTSKARTITKAYLGSWYKAMRNLSTYNEYAHYVDSLYSILRRSEQELGELSTDLKANWLEGKALPFNV